MTLTTTDGSIDVFGQWDVGFSGDNVLLDSAVPEETEAANTETMGDAEFSVTDLEVSESGCSFWVHTKQDNYLMVPIGQLALVQESNPGTACYGISMITGRQHFSRQSDGKLLADVHKRGHQYAKSCVLSGGMEWNH